MSIPKTTAQEHARRRREHKRTIKKNNKLKEIHKHPIDYLGLAIRRPALTCDDRKLCGKKYSKKNIENKTRTKKMKKLSDEQISELCYIIGEWYFDWKDRMTDNHQPHRLGISREDLKKRIEARMR